MSGRRAQPRAKDPRQQALWRPPHVKRVQAWTYTTDPGVRPATGEEMRRMAREGR